MRGSWPTKNKMDVRGQGGVPSVRGKLLEASTAIVKIIGHENVIYSSQIKWQFCGIYLRICSGVNSRAPPQTELLEKSHHSNYRLL